MKPFSLPGGGVFCKNGLPSLDGPFHNKTGRAKARVTIDVITISEGDATMATQERVYTVDDVWRLEQEPRHPTEKYYLIDGELCIKMSPNESHGEIANLVAYYLTGFVLERGLGRVGVEVGFHPPGDRGTVLLPDVSFISAARMARRARDTYVPYMPDLAVEIISPSQSLSQVRRKAEAYLRHGTVVVWLVDPIAKTAEIWRRGDDGAPNSETIRGDGELSGDDMLPGFRLPLERIFSS
jgi:Uma2 family endonuclease